MSLPEFFLDRGLGRGVAEGLRDLGWMVHRITDYFPDDAQQTDDEVWLACGLERGWVPMCKKTAGSRAAAPSGSRSKLMLLSSSTWTTSSFVGQR